MNFKQIPAFPVKKPQNLSFPDEHLRSGLCKIIIEIRMMRNSLMWHTFRYKNVNSTLILNMWKKKKKEESAKEILNIFFSFFYPSLFNIISITGWFPLPPFTHTLGNENTIFIPPQFEGSVLVFMHFNDEELMYMKRERWAFILSQNTTWKRLNASE